MLAGEMQDQTVDWWMLGTLIYRMLIGMSPFHELNEEDIPHAILKKEVEFPNKKDHQIEISDTARNLIS